VALNTSPCAGVWLAAARATKALVLSWPLPYTNFVLESAPSLLSTNWQRVPQTTKTNNGRCEVTLSADRAQCYFRLRKW